MAVVTTSDLIRQVRVQLQESNEAQIDDNDIFDALNRGNDYAWDIMARLYPDPLVTVHKDADGNELLLNADARGEILIPEGIFEEHLQKVDLVQSGISYELERQSYRQTTPFRNNVVGSRPIFYNIKGRTIEFLPTTSNFSGFQFRLYYLRDLDALVPVQGQISDIVDSATAGGDSYVVLDNVGSDLSTSDPYNKYVNICNAQTGEVRATLEIQNITGNKITFKTSPSRTKVLGRNVSGDVPTDGQPDDYLSTVHGSCVLFFKKPMSNMVIQYAVAELRRALGYDVGIEQSALKKMEDQVKHQWAGRESQFRIKRRNYIWRVR